MVALAEEGCDSRNLARLAARMRRANAALEIMVDSAERSLAFETHHGEGWDAGRFSRPCRTRFGFACCCAASIGSAPKARPNSARSRPCWRSWTSRSAKSPGSEASKPLLKRAQAGALINAGGRTAPHRAGAATPSPGDRPADAGPIYRCFGRTLGGFSTRSLNHRARPTFATII